MTGGFGDVARLSKTKGEKLLNTLIRIALGLAGIAMLLDALLPISIAQATIDRHSSALKRDTNQSWNTRSHETYKLHFFGSKIETCTVGLNAYSNTEDGDVVTVRFSKIFKNCSSVEKNGSLIYEHHGWRWFYTLCGTVLLLGALGAFPSFQLFGRELT